LHMRFATLGGSLRTRFPARDTAGRDIMTIQRQFFRGVS
jgi:hypothetical protein